MPQPARLCHTQQVHYLRRNIAYTDTSGTQYELGTIPKNAVVLATYVHVTTAFNAGTTNTVDVGTSGAASALVSGQSVGSVGGNRVTPATLGGVLSASADTTLYGKYTQSGTAATTGAGIIVVEYIPDGDR